MAGGGRAPGRARMRSRRRQQHAAELTPAARACRRQRSGLNAPPKAGAGGSATLSIEGSPKAKAAPWLAGWRRWAGLLALAALAAGAALGAGVLIGHAAWPRTVTRVAPVPGFFSRPDVIVSAARPALAAPCTGRGLIPARRLPARMTNAQLPPCSPRAGACPRCHAAARRARSALEKRVSCPQNCDRMSPCGSLPRVAQAVPS